MKDRFEKRHQIRQIHPRDLTRHRSKVEARDMADKIADGVHCVLAAESRGLRIDPIVERLPTEGRIGAGEQLGEHA